MPFGKLLRPLDYVRVNHPEKWWYDLWIPLALASVATVIWAALPLQIPIHGPDGLLSIFTGLLQILTGFYIASLAAVATFNRPGMDEPMSGVPPTLRVRARGTAVIERLTRRRFLSLMFGYLSLLSLVLYFAGGFAELLAPNLLYLVPRPALTYARTAFVFGYLLLASNLVVTTLLGFYYMADRLHRPRQLLDVRNPEAVDAQSVDGAAGTTSPTNHA